MISELFSAVPRRDFLKLAGAAAACGIAHGALAVGGKTVAVVMDAHDAMVASGPVKRAAARLREALIAKGAGCQVVDSLSEAKGASMMVVVAAEGTRLASGFPVAGGGLTGAESLRIAPGMVAGAAALLVSAIDTRGYVYGLLELAERVEFGADVAAGLHWSKAIEERPANEIRCVSRYFCSELEDKSWYYDKDFWRSYLDLLVACRFNRFAMAYGLEYDFPKGVTDDYLHLPYPYLVEVPGYEGVHVLQLVAADGTRLPSPVVLSKEEKAKNLEMLRFIAAETGARGLHFQLGIWTHAYKWTDSPNGYHSIEGLTAETHATYCRDALAMILKECPEIAGLTMRVHGESGIPEGSYPFWKTLFEAIADCGRKIEVEMHAKGVNQTMIDMAVATGMPVKLGAKYSAEHQSLGYNQADIRALEIPKTGGTESALFSVSSGARSFTRYGYADFFEEGSKAQLVYRLWPGTQRHLLSADPEMAAAYARTVHFCGAAGLDIMEPLTFKGREGSGHAGGRCGYADASLTPKYDWKKFELFYRVWGRRLYDPDADAEAWGRWLRSRLGSAAGATETALANASRVLPLVTSAHLASASNHSFWPEIYDNMPIVAGSEKSPYGDTPEPRVFGTVSPLDPQMFSTIAEFAGELLTGTRSGKYSPIEVAVWLEEFTGTSAQALAVARAAAGAKTAAEFRRVEEDVLIQNGLGRFFAAKLRSGVLFEVFEQTGSAEAGRLAVERYQAARDAWAAMAKRAAKVYGPDVSYGSVPQRRGHWMDRLPGIDVDLAAMRSKVQSGAVAAGDEESAARAVRVATGKGRRAVVDCEHMPPAAFHAGEALKVEVRLRAGSGSSMVLWYRHVNQAERWRRVDMVGNGGGFGAAIPGAYTESAYPLQYYFEGQSGAGEAWVYPGLNSTLSNQPYYAIAKRSA